MTLRNRAEAQEVITGLAQRDSEIRREDEVLTAYIEGAERFVRYAWLFGSLVVAITVWTAKVQWDIAQITKDVEKLIAYREEGRLSKVTDQILLQTIQNTIAANRVERMTVVSAMKEEIDLLKQDSPKTREMWFMQQHGISNKENYYRETGKSAPANQTSPNQTIDR